MESDVYLQFLLYLFNTQLPDVDSMGGCKGRKENDSSNQHQSSPAHGRSKPGRHSAMFQLRFLIDRLTKTRSEVEEVPSAITDGR